MTIALTARERRLVEELRVLAALGTDAQVIRLALHNLADHYDLDLAAGEFEYLRDRLAGPPAVGCLHGTRVGHRCRTCEAEIARTLADYRLDQLEGKYDAAGFTPAERVKGRRRCSTKSTSNTAS